MVEITHGPLSRPLRRPSRVEHGGPRIRFAIAACARLAASWIDRARQRRALAEMDDRLLSDIGVSRSEAEREIEKPFWR
jgi:uncharacterized protein YjiS (DUF1127 family)